MVDIPGYRDLHALHSASYSGDWHAQVWLWWRALRVEVRLPRPAVSRRVDSDLRHQHRKLGEDTRYVCVITDLLPPTFSYKAGSSSGITTADPTSAWDADYDRWELDWRNPADGNGDFPPLITVAPGQTKTQTLQATADIQTDTTYFNEVRVVYSNGNDVDNCRKALEPSDGGTIHGGASSSGSAQSAPTYDIRAVSSDGQVLSRVIVSQSQSQSQVYIISWQEN